MSALTAYFAKYTIYRETDWIFDAKQLNQEMHMQAIVIISEALSCIIFGQSCMFCIMERRKM